MREFDTEAQLTYAAVPNGEWIKVKDTGAGFYVQASGTGITLASGNVAVPYTGDVGLLSSVANSTQSIPIHDGLVATEIPIDLGTASDEYLDISGSVMTALKESSRALINLAINTTTSGGGNKIAVLTIWSETSVDGGTTWFPNADSLRSVSIADESAGSAPFIYSVDGAFPIGAKTRFVATNTGDPTSVLSLSNVPSLTTSNGAVSGQSSHIAIIYGAT
jgi:hypothetical protein